MKDEQMEAQEGIRQAKEIAAQLGVEIATRTDSARVGVYAAAITYAGFCAMHGVSLHSSLELLMNLYKQLDRMNEDLGPMQ